VAGTATLDVYNSEILALETNSIIITVNYRVGAFGFLFLGIEEAAGKKMFVSLL